jgi:serine/threonine protein kinase
VQLARAFAAALARGELHLRLSPACIQIGRDGSVSLEGLPSASSSWQVERTLPPGERPLPPGEPPSPYCSPEQLRGEPADARSDVFSLGCALYQLAAGRPPFEAATPQQLTSALLHAAPPPLPASTPLLLARVIGRCLEKEPARRYASAAKVLDALLGRGAGTTDTNELELTTQPPSTGRAAPDLGPRYQRLTPLAHGGMGTVYQAFDTVLGRTVAVKMLRGEPDPATLARFEREALLTARLHHPGIVTVFEFARTGAGEPYLTLPRVRGEPLEAAIGRAATLGQRLGLLGVFTGIVEAVAYAHDQGVVHRDLKPSNVLLGEFGESLVIDWGLAKDLRAPGADPELPAPAQEAARGQASDPQLTRLGQVLGTPAYMSPEQARGEPADQRSDVYAVGAMLYHLLSGARPYRGSSAQEAVELVCAGPPLPLAQAAPGLSLELASIVERAMAREPSARLTARELAAELRAFQAGRLVSSHTYSTLQLVRRWMRRHALLLSVSAVLLVLLNVAAAMAVRKILAERATAESALAFMTSIFKVADPREHRGETLTVREVLDGATAQLQKEAVQDPGLEIRLLAAIAKVYEGLTLYPKALELVDRELALLRESAGAGRELLRARNDRAVLLFELSRFAEAEGEARALLGDVRSALGRHDPLTLTTLGTLGVSLKNLGRNAEAEAILRELFVASRKQLGPDHPETARTQNNLAGTLIELGRTAEAEEMLRDLIERRTRLLGPDHPRTLYSMNGLAWSYMHDRRWAEAEPLNRELLRQRLRVLGPGHLDVAQSEANLALCLRALGRYGEAEAMSQGAVAIYRRALPEGHALVASELLQLAATQVAAGEREQALATLAEAVENKEPAPEAKRLGSDPAFAALKGEARFEALAAKAAAR